MRSAETNTVALISMVTHSAPIHSMRLSGCCETKSKTVARAEGPAIEGTASGTMSGSTSISVSATAGGGNTMRRAIKNKITPPPICRASSERFMTRKKPSPTNIKASSKKNAMLISRKMTLGRRSGATCLSALANTGILPTGSVMSTNKMVAETKV